VVRRPGPRGSWLCGAPTSTFLYATIYAAGFTIDAKAKAGRIIPWEEAFAQLRDALDRPLDGPKTSQKVDHQHHGAVVGSQMPGGVFEEADWQYVHRVASMELGDSDALHEQEVSQLNASNQIWHDLRLDSRLPGTQALAWPANTGRDMIPHHLPPQSLWAPDELRWSAMRKRHTRKKLAMQELVTGFLIYKMIKDINLARYLNSANGLLDSLAPPIRQIAMSTGATDKRARTAFMMDIERLHLVHVSSSNEHVANARVHVEDSWIPRYHQDPDGDYYEICKQMNDGITQLLRDCGKGNEKEKGLVVAKICHNLLVSTAAPDLHTFNILLAGFTLWRRDPLVDDVIAAFHASKVRPNELLCTQILNHYTMQARAGHFTRFVAKMRGVGDALALANPDITINEAGQERLVRVNEDKVLQKIHPTPMVFAALINGVLKFAGFDRALDVYYEMKADGWGLAVPGLTKLLADCIRRADWEGGTYVWEEINSIKTRVKPSYVARAYQHMLSLCSVTGNTVAFNQVLNEVAKRGFDQKSIINAAMKTTRWAQRGGDSLAPAWAADNLMIAVSGYINDSRVASNEVDGLPTHDTEIGDGSFAQSMVHGEATALDRQAGTVPSERVDAAANKEEAWSSWIEHEVGKRPKDPEP
jgi:hypothetical protein